MPGKCLHKRELIQPLVVPKELIHIVNHMIVRVLNPHSSLELPEVVEPRQLLRRAPELVQQVIDLGPFPDPIRKVDITKLLPKHRDPPVLSHIVPDRLAMCQIGILMPIQVLVGDNAARH